MGKKEKFQSIEQLVEKFDLDGSDNKIKAFLMALVTRDINRERELTEARKNTRYDELTGLERKGYLWPFLERNISRANRHYEDVTVLMIDVDNFKKYNDQHGHLQGDEALSTIGRVANESFRKEDLVVRYGGDEICAVLPKTSAKDAEGFAERLRRTIENTQLLPAVGVLDGSYKYITISIGGFTYNPSLNAVLEFLDKDVTEAKKAKVLLVKADEALYRAKETGKNRYCTTRIK